MGIFRLGQLAKERSAVTRKGPVLKPAAAPPTPSAGDKLRDAIDRVLTFVPTEIIGLYVTLTAFFAPGAAAEKWALYALCCAMVPLFLWLGSALAAVPAGVWSESPGKRLSVLTLLSVVAFSAWACALPNTPFESLVPNATRWGGGAVLILAALLPRIASKLDLTG